MALGVIDVQPAPTASGVPVPAATADLGDGWLLSLRRLNPADYPEVLALHECLSDQDRYLRFFTSRPAHLPRLAGMLTDPGVDGCAIGAFLRGDLVGVANYVVTGAHTADAAVAVARHCRSHGVGTALLGQLAGIARSDGIRVATADVLTQNYRMLGVLAGLDLPCRRTGYGPVTSFRIDIGGARASAADAAFQRGLGRWADLTFGDVGWPRDESPLRHVPGLGPVRRIRALRGGLRSFGSSHR